MPRAAPRYTDLQLIHIAKKQLDMPDDQYRDIVFTIGRVRSSKDLDHAGRARLLEHFKACGFEVKPKAGKAAKPRNEWSFVFGLPQSRQVHLRKIFRLAQAIGALQDPPVPVMSKAWVEGMLQQMRGHNASDLQPAPIATRLEMANEMDLRPLVQGLEMHKRRLESRNRKLPD